MPIPVIVAIAGIVWTVLCILFLLVVLRRRAKRSEEEAAREAAHAKKERPRIPGEDM